MCADNDVYVYRDTCTYVDIDMNTHNTDHVYTDGFSVASHFYLWNAYFNLLHLI